MNWIILARERVHLLAVLIAAAKFALQRSRGRGVQFASYTRTTLFWELLKFYSRHSALLKTIMDILVPKTSEIPQQPSYT
jgi:hypothetical protein